MKHLKLFLLILIAFGVSVSSCKKTTDETTEEIIDDLLDIKGSISLNVDGVTYNKLFSSVVYTEDNKSVSFWAYELDSNEDSFVVTFGEVPSVGETSNINPDLEDSITLMIIGSFMEDGTYFAQSGTIKRVSTDKYEINVVLVSLIDGASTHSLSGTVNVGEHN